MSPEESLDQSRAPLLDHLIELRTRLLRSIIALAIAFVICMIFVKPIYAILLKPLRDTGQVDLYTTTLFEGFFTQVRVGFFAALMLAFPFISNQMWRFIAPGLYKHEKDAFKPFLMMTPVLFALGASLAYFVVVPLAFKSLLLFFSGNINGVTLKTLPTAGDYLSKLMTFLFGFGVAFQLPVLLMILERAGFVTREQLRKGRRYAIVGSAGIAAVLTPPDPVSMLLLLVPMMVLYEFALVAIWFTQRKRPKAAETEETQNG